MRWDAMNCSTNATLTAHAASRVWPFSNRHRVGALAKSSSAPAATGCTGSCGSTSASFRSSHPAINDITLWRSIVSPLWRTFPGCRPSANRRDTSRINRSFRSTYLPKAARRHSIQHHPKEQRSRMARWDGGSPLAGVRPDYESRAARVGCRPSQSPMRMTRHLPATWSRAELRWRAGEARLRMSRETSAVGAQPTSGHRGELREERKSSWRLRGVNKKSTRERAPGDLKSLPDAYHSKMSPR